jgi:hypothetical protein
MFCCPTALHPRRVSTVHRLYTLLMCRHARPLRELIERNGFKYNGFNTYIPKCEPRSDNNMSSYSCNSCGAEKKHQQKRNQSCSRYKIHRLKFEINASSFVAAAFIFIASSFVASRLRNRKYKNNGCDIHPW